MYILLCFLILFINIVCFFSYSFGSVVIYSFAFVIPLLIHVFMLTPLKLLPTIEIFFKLSFSDNKFSILSAIL